MSTIPPASSPPPNPPPNPPTPPAQPPRHSLLQLACDWLARASRLLRVPWAEPTHVWAMRTIDETARAAQPADVGDPRSELPCSVWPDNLIATLQGYQTVAVGSLTLQAPCWVLRDRESGEALPWIFQSVAHALQAVERLSGMICDILPASDAEAELYGIMTCSFGVRERTY